MSALGQKRTSEDVKAMSALPPKADIGTQLWNVRFVPKANVSRCRKISSKSGLFDHFVGGSEQVWLNSETERLDGGEIDRQ
jgi:hypothetical protein